MVKLVNKYTHQWFYAKLGLSWTNFFFGPWVPLFRGEGGQFWIYMLINTCTFGIYQIVMLFLFNKQYIQRKFQNGWLPATKSDRDMLQAYDILAPNSLEENNESTEATILYKPNRIGFYILLILNIIGFFMIMGYIATIDTSYYY